MLLNPAEAATILKVSKRTLLDWVAKGRVKAVRLSRKTVRIPLSELPLSDDERTVILGRTPTPALPPATEMLA